MVKGCVHSLYIAKDLIQYLKNCHATVDLQKMILKYIILTLLCLVNISSAQYMSSYIAVIILGKWLHTS